MRKFIASVVLLSFAAAPCAASDFMLNVGSPIMMLETAAPALQVPAAPPASVKVKAGQAVQVSGQLTLSGTAWIYQNGGFTNVNLGGWVRFSDASGKINSDNIYVTVNTGIWMYPNQHLFQSVFPSAQVNFYRDGKPLGSASMRGSFTVSGWASANSVTISGAGRLTGSLYVADIQP